VRTLRTLCELTCVVKDRPSDDGSSDTPQGAKGGLTPRRVAFAAALALAEGLVPLPFEPVRWWWLVRAPLRWELKIAVCLAYANVPFLDLVSGFVEEDIVTVFCGD